MKIKCKSGYINAEKSRTRDLPSLKHWIWSMVLSLFIIPAFAQSTKLTLHLKDKTIVTVIETIEAQSDYLFYYNSKLLNMKQTVSIDADNETLESVLDLLFKNTGIAYRINGTDIILTLPHLEPASQSKKNRTIQGFVKDSEGNPLVGASVLIIGTNIGVTTDQRGYYSLIVPDKESRLRISFIGYVPQEFVIGSRSEIVTTLEEDVNVMDDIVVIGYGTLEKKAVTSSITSIRAKDLVKGLGGSNIATALQGKISGMTINTTSSPNASSDFQLRGVASINASQSPLVVIDGIPGGNINTIYQEDIQSIDVLKDASAGAIYGTRAAGGVILITTKQANEGPIKLTYTGEFSTEQVSKRPEVLDRERFLHYGLGSDMGHNTDWYDELLNEGALSQRHVVNLSGGSRNARVYATFVHQNQKGISIGDNRKDYSARINGKFSLLNNLLEFQIHSQYQQVMRDNRSSAGDFNMALKLNPTISPYDSSSDTGYNVWKGGFDDYNPVADIMLKQCDVRDKWFTGDVTAKLNILPFLSAQATVGYQDRAWNYTKYTSAYHKESLDNGYQGMAYQGSEHQGDLSFETTVNFSRKFGRHDVGAVAGYSFWERNGDKFNMTNYDFPVDGVGAWDIGKGSYLSDGLADMYSYKNPRERLIAFFGRVNYSFDNKYILTGSYRREGSSKFGKNNKWGNFYAISGGWRISEERFLENIRILDDLKIRLGYGVTGNNGFSAGKSTRMYASNSWWIYDNNWVISYGSAKNVNYDLHWEEKSELNIGLDYALFNNRLYGKLDIYWRKVHGMIYDISVPSPPYVYDKMTMNYGDLENRGWEFEIGGIPIRTAGFSWTTTMRLSQNRSKITSLWGNNTYQDRVSFPAPGTPGNGGRLEEGTEIGQYFIWKYAGVNSEGQWLVYDKNDNIILGDKKVYNDKRYIGNGIPKLIVAWDHQFSYKNWSLGINLRSWIGHDVFNTINMYYGISTVENQNTLRSAFIENRHIKQEKLLCDYWLEDGSFLKIDAVSLGYTLNMKKYQKYIDKINIYLTVRNVACFTNYTGLDPEVNINGLDPGYEWHNDIYPQTRRFTLGAQFVF